MTFVLRIDPCGDVTRCAGNDLLWIAGQWFPGGLDVVSMPTPQGAPAEFPQAADGLLVGAVAAWGVSEGAAVNPKAWALYGRSPIVGVCFVALDRDDDGERLELDDEFIAALEADWVQPPMVLVPAMKSISATRGLAWPS